MSMERFLSNFRKAPAGIQRHGLGLWFQLLEEHFTPLFWANLFTALAMLPFFGCVYFVVATGDMMFWLAAIVFLTLAGPLITAMHSVCARVAHQMPVWVREDFKQSIKRDWKASLLLTFIVAVLWSGLAYAVTVVSSVNGGITLPFLVIFGVYAYFLTGFTMYSYLQLSMLELSLSVIMKNSLLLIFAGKGRSAGAIAFSLAVVIVGVMYWFYAMLACFVFLMALLVFSADLIVSPVFSELFMEDKKS